jgi:glutamate synthase domain-containing protein 1
MKRLLPILQPIGSDSTSLDNMFEFLLANGVDFFKAARSLVPAPWQNSPHMDSNLRAFYEYTSTAMEAWDGPAAVSLTDGRHIGCLIDRNLFISSSEKISDFNCSDFTSTLNLFASTELISPLCAIALNG